MSFLTIFFAIFTIVLYVYLILAKRELVFVALRRSQFSIIAPVVVAGLMAVFYFFEETLDGRIRTILSILLVLSYLFNVRGITNDRFIMQALDNRGIKLSEIERVVVFKDTKQQVIKLNFFRRGVRGPLFKFNTTLEELIPFLTTHLYEETQIEVIVNSDK